jgi:hypothetical protein
MSKAPKERHFGESEPQITNVYQYKPPPELAPIDSDESRGDRKNPRPRVMEDEKFDHEFTPEPEHTKKYDFSKHLERGKK